MNSTDGAGYGGFDVLQDGEDLREATCALAIHSIQLVPRSTASHVAISCHVVISF
jgi:hypothetical protein